MERYVVDPGWRILLTDLGLQPGDLLRRAGLPEDLLARSDAGLAPADYYRLWEVLAAEVGPGMLPARMLEALSAEMFSPPLFAALCSPDLAVAAARMRDFKPLIGPMRLDVQRTPDALSIGIGFGPGPSVPPGALVAFELGFFVQLARIATRHRVVPRTATSTSDVTALGPFTDFLGVPGFYPVNADTHEKAHTGPKECSCRNASVTARSSSGRRSSWPAGQMPARGKWPWILASAPTC